MTVSGKQKDNCGHQKDSNHSVKAVTENSKQPLAEDQRPDQVTHPLVTSETNNQEKLLKNTIKSEDDVNIDNKTNMNHISKVPIADDVQVDGEEEMDTREGKRVSYP